MDYVYVTTIITWEMGWVCDMFTGVSHQLSGKTFSILGEERYDDSHDLQHGMRQLHELLH